MPSRSLLSALVLLLAAPSVVAAQELGIEVGARAPGALVQTMDGKSVDLASYLGRTPVVIEFWAFWCPSCKELEPAFLAAQKKYGSRVRFLAVAVSVNQTAQRAKAYADRHGYRHELLYDANGHATDAYDVPATSYIVVVDSKGTVVYTGLGGKQDLEVAIRKAVPR